MNQQVLRAFHRRGSQPRRESVYPLFATLDKAAHHVRAITTRGLYRRVYQAIPQEARTTLDALFVVEDGARLSGWEQLKEAIRFLKQHEGKSWGLVDHGDGAESRHTRGTAHSPG